MVELVDTPVLEAGAEMRASSSLALGTNYMKIAILEFNNIGIDVVQTELDPTVVLTSTQINPDLMLADLALQLDEYMVLENNIVDVVYVNKDADFDRYKFANHQMGHNEICFISNKITGSFFCKPNLLSLVANLYKIDFTKKFTPTQYDIHFLTDTHAKKMLYIIDRLGIDINVL